MRYRFRGLHSMIVQGGSFEVLPDDGASIFVATVRQRGGSAAHRLMAVRIGHLAVHMREEGQNLRRIVERVASQA